LDRGLAFGSPIDGLLERLYAQHDAQDDALAAYFTARAVEPSFDWNNFDARTNEFLKDKLIALENEPEKVRVARSHFAEAGVSDLVDLREGDLRDTLRDVPGPIDFMLIDIWTPMARPALELIAPRLREGAVVICDNTQQFRDAYGEYFEFVNDVRNGLRTMTLPFDGGLEFTVRAS